MIQAQDGHIDRNLIILLDWQRDVDRVVWSCSAGITVVQWS